MVTSGVAYALGVGTLGLTPGRLRAAVVFAFQVIGMSTLFFLANAAVGLICILAFRSVTDAFVSAYLLNDVTLCGLSALQGVCFECWRTRGGRGDR